MSHRQRLASVLAMACAIGAPTVGGQVSDPSGRSDYVAFRVDGQRVIATLYTRETTGPQVHEGLSPRPLARFGYEHFEVPGSWRNLPDDVAPGQEWVVHLSAGATVHATVDRIVGGYVGCQEAIGVLLNVSPRHGKAFATSSARYFVATPAEPHSPGITSISPVRTLSAAALTPPARRSLESTLNQIMTRELPRVREEAAPSLLGAVENHPYRSMRRWAQERLRIEDAMARGQGQLKYDVQAFQLSPDGPPVYFVRAEWLVGARQGFAGAFWLRGHEALELLTSNVWPASAMRSGLFQGGVVRAHLGMVLAVTDRDYDGWGEVLFAWEGYENRSITLLEYSPAGLQPTGVEMSGGC